MPQYSTVKHHFVLSLLLKQQQN